MTLRRLGLAALAAVAAPGWACSCAPPAEPAQWLQASSLVAVGRVQAVRSATRQDPMQVFRGGQLHWDLVATPVLVFELRVDEAFTGANEGQTVRLQALGGTGDCGRLAPRPGETLLVVARPAPTPPDAAGPISERAAAANRGLPLLEALGGRCAPGGRLPQARDQLDALRRQAPRPASR